MGEMEIDGIGEMPGIRYVDARIRNLHRYAIVPVSSAIIARDYA